jgi:hypothetical protein
MDYDWGCEEEWAAGSAWAFAAALLARKTKKEAAPMRTVPMTPIKVKMLALRLRAMVESDWPKQAEQASAHGAEARTNTTLNMADKPNLFIGS